MSRCERISRYKTFAYKKLFFVGVIQATCIPQVKATCIPQVKATQVLNTFHYLYTGVAGTTQTLLFTLGRVLWHH